MFQISRDRIILSIADLQDSAAWNPKPESVEISGGNMLKRMKKITNAKNSSIWDDT